LRWSWSFRRDVAIVDRLDVVKRCETVVRLRRKP
jgi:hypothetical protein